MKHFYLTSVFLSMLLFVGCNSEEASENERVTSRFTDSLGVSISALQWWKTTVKVKVNVTTEKPVKLALLSSGSTTTWLYDYKEVSSSGIVMMTAPQGQGNTLKLVYNCNSKNYSEEVLLTGSTEETVTINTKQASKKSAKRRFSPAASLCGSSISAERGEPAQYYQFDNNQLKDYYKMMEFSVSNSDAKSLGLNCNYELESQGPFYITWVNGYMGKPTSCILGYYTHTHGTYSDIEYVDLSETHKFDYVDGLAKVQYQINTDFSIDGHVFFANTWYDANFDLTDKFGATSSYVEPDRIGDNAYNSQEVYLLLHKELNILSALRGISFKINVPEGKRIGFYLRSEGELDRLPEQWGVLTGMGIPPYVDDADEFMGTCFSAEFMNVVGNGGGLHRSFIKAYDNVYWMGMEDVAKGGDHDCNDVIFGVVSELKIHMPKIVDAKLPEPPEPEEDIEDLLDGVVPFPWTIAYEDVNRNADFDFNDAVIKLVPDFENEECCVWVMAAGSNTRMYLHFDGPDGDENLGEIHELLGSKNAQTYINTKEVVANTPFVEVDCVPWPKEYTMGQDAKRFYIEVERGDCGGDCTDLITLANDPGQLPEALLVSGEWHWPLEGTNIISSYEEFSKWAHDPTRTRYWGWYDSPVYGTNVSY